eukprot:scaffold2380_cov102-Isochrysis_galbana.AAC.15
MLSGRPEARGVDVALDPTVRAAWRSGATRRGLGTQFMLGAGTIWRSHRMAGSSPWSRSASARQRAGGRFSVSYADD